MKMIKIIMLIILVMTIIMMVMMMMMMMMMMMTRTKSDQLVRIIFDIVAWLRMPRTHAYDNNMGDIVSLDNLCPFKFTGFYSFSLLYYRHANVVNGDTFGGTSGSRLAPVPDALTVKTDK